MTYVMSDIHGHYDKYREMLETIEFAADDTLYVLGDVLDRGSDGFKTLLDMTARPNVIGLLGNHEERRPFCNFSSSAGKKWRQYASIFRSYPPMRKSPCRGGSFFWSTPDWSISPPPALWKSMTWRIFCSAAPIWMPPIFRIKPLYLGTRLPGYSTSRLGSWDNRTGFFIAA